MGALEDLIDKLNAENKKLKEKVEKLSEQIEALKKETKQETPKGEIWKPKKGDIYWYIDYAGNVFSGECFGNLELVVGNMYPTEEKAEFEAQREKYTRLFRQYVEQHDHYCNMLDFGDFSSPKYYVYFNGANDEVEIGADYEEKKAFQVYGSSEEVMRDAVEFVGRENFLRYIIGVEENNGD